jgi:hypothetical protein
METFVSWSAAQTLSRGGHADRLTRLRDHSTGGFIFMASFTWVGGADINGPNNWTTPANWQVGGIAATTVPNSAADDATVNSDLSASDAIISGGQAITVASLSIGNAPVATVPGGHVIVGGSADIGGGGGGTLTSAGAISVASTNAGGGLVGGIGGVIIAPSMTLAGPGVVIGGGGTFDIPSIVNNGEIQADGGNFGLGTLVLNSTAITGTGFIEVDGASAVEINAATAEAVQVAVSPGQTASVIFDQPTAFTGGLNLLTPNSAVELFFKGQSPTGVTYNPDAHTLVITGAGGATLDTIPFVSDGAVALAVVPSTMAGYGEVALGPAAATSVVPQIPPPVNGISTTTLTSAELSQLLQGNQSAMRFVSGTEAIVLVDGTLSVGPDTNEAFLTRLYDGLLGRAPDENGLSSWDAVVGSSSKGAVAQAFLNSPEFQTAHPGQDDNSFVQGLYQGLLGRPADAGGLTAWTQMLAGGMSRSDAAVAFADSPEAKQHWSGVTSNGIFAYNPNSAVVREDYQTGFGRDADSSGLAAWTGFLNTGATPAQLAQVFAQSPEFQSLHGQQTDLQYVDSLYQSGLGRPADPGGEAAWVSALQTGTSRGGLLATFAQSPESQQHLQWALNA